MEEMHRQGLGKGTWILHTLSAHRNGTPYPPTNMCFITKDTPVTCITQKITRIFGTLCQKLGAETKSYLLLCHSNKKKFFPRISWKKLQNLPALTKGH